MTNLPCVFSNQNTIVQTRRILPCIRALEQKDEVRNVISCDGLCVGKPLGRKLCTEKENAG